MGDLNNSFDFLFKVCLPGPMPRRRRQKTNLLILKDCSDWRFWSRKIVRRPFRPAPLRRRWTLTPHLATVCPVVSLQYQATIFMRRTSAWTFHEGRIQPELQVDHWCRVCDQGHHCRWQAGEGSDLGHWCVQFGSHGIDLETNGVHGSWSGTVPGYYCRVSSVVFVSYTSVLTTVCH